MSLIYNKSCCRDCFDSEDGICSPCSVEWGYCLNCIYYGNGGLCTNCRILGDEGVCLEFDLQMIFTWIEYNDEYFTIQEQAYEELGFI
jgi:hypothetical protein